MGYYDDLIDEENQGELVEFEEIIEEDGCEQENPSETDYDNYVKENSKKKVSAYADEEENEIIKRAQADDQEAWNLIFKKYALFRHYLLYKMERRIFGKVTKEDLESYIDEGIVKAVREFDETKGNKFFTFLFITTKTRVMRLNLRNSRRYYQEDVLVQSDMNDQFVVSIDDKVGLNNKSEEGRLLAELIADTSDAERQAQEDIAEFALKIFALVKNEIAKDYFISKANEPSIVYNDIAKKYGITRSRVEQLVKRERNNILRQIEKSKEVYELLVIQKESIEFVSSTLELSESQIADYLKFYKHLYEHNEKIGVVEEKKFQVDNKLFYKYGPCVKSPILYAYLELCNRFGDVSIKDFLKSMGDVLSMGRFNTEIEKAKIKCGKLLSQAQKVYSYYTKTKSLARTADLFDMDAGEVRELFDVYLYFYQDGALSFKESGIAQRIKTMLSQLVSGPRRMNSFDMYNAGGTNNKSNLIFEDMFLMKAYELGVDISQEQLLRAESLYDKLDDFNELWGCLFNDKAFEIEVAEGQQNSQSQLTEYEKIEMLFPYNLPIRAYCKMQNGNATQSDDLLKLVVKYYSKSLDASAELISKAKENVESFILKSKKVGEEVKSGRSVEQIAEEIGEQLSFVKFYSEAYGYIFNDEIMPIENPLEAQRLIEAIDEIEEISKSFNCYLASIKGESVEKLVERLGGIKCAIARLITRQKDSLNEIINTIYNIAKDLIGGVSRTQIAVKSDISARMCSVYEREFPSILLGEKPHIPDFALEFDESIKDKISSIESAKVYRLRRFEQRTLAEIADETGMLVVDIKKLLKKQDSLVSDYLKQKDSESGFDLETAFNNCVSVNQRSNANRIRKKDKSRLDEVDLISLAQKAFPMDKGLQILKSVKVDGDTIGEIAVLCGIPVDEINQIIENATEFVKELFTKVKRMEEARGNAEFIKEVFPNEHERSFYLSMLNSLKAKKVPARNPIQGAIYTGIVKSQEYIGFEDKSNILSRYYIFGERKDTLAENLGVTKWCVNDMIRKSESALQKVVGKFEQVYDAVTAGNPIKQVAEETNIPVVQIQNVYEYAKRLFFLTAENLDLTKFMNIQTGADFYSENKEKINTVLMKYKPLLVTNRMAEKYDLVLQNLINGVPLQKLAGGVAGVRSSLQGIKRAVLESVKSHMLLADSCHNVIEQGQAIEAFATTFNLSEEEVADYARLYDYFYFDGELPERFNMELKRKDNREESKRDKNNGSREKEPGSKVGIQAVVDANNNTSNPQVDLDWSRVFENVSGLMSLIKPVDKAELCRVVELFAHHYDKSPKAKTFRNVVYNTCVNKIPLKVVCENSGVNYLSCSAARSAYIREIKGHLTLCKVAMLAKKSSQSDLFYWLQAELKLSDADIEQYSKLYSYVYDNGEDVDGWVPKSIAREIKLIEQKQQELEDKVKAELESRKILEGEAVVEIENGYNGNIESDEKLQTSTPKQNECVVHMDSGEELVDTREKETVVDGNVQPSDTENVINETLIHSKRKERPKGSKNKKKGNPEGFFEIENSEMGYEESQPEEIVSKVKEARAKERSSVRKLKRQKEAKQTEVSKNSVQTFASPEIIERLTSLYEYDLRMKVLRGAVVDNRSDEELMSILGVDDVGFVKSAITEAEIELLMILADIKKTSIIGMNSDAEFGYKNYMYQYLVGEKTRAYQNHHEQLRIVSILENDPYFMYDLSNYKAYLKLGKSMIEYAKNNNKNSNTVSTSLMQAKHRIEDEVKKAKRVYELRSQNKNDDEICTEVKIPQGQVVRYINLYDSIYRGRPINDYISREKKEIYLKLFDFIDNGKMYSLQMFLTTKESIAQIAERNNVAIAQIKSEIKDGIAILDALIERIGVAKRNGNPEISKVERLHLVKLYEYLYVGGVRPVRPLSEMELMIKLRGVYTNDKRFDFMYEHIVEGKTLEGFAEEAGTILESVRNKKYQIRHILNNTLYQAEICYDETIRFGAVTEETKSALVISDERVNELVKLYNYLYNDGELVRFEKITQEKPNKEKTVRTLKETVATTIDRVDLLTKLANFYVYDLRYKAIKQELVDGVAFADTLSEFNLSESEVEEIRGSIYRDLEELTTKIIKVGYVKKPRIKHSEKAKEFGESGESVAHYERLYNYLFKGGDAPNENYLETRRLLKVFSEYGIRTNNMQVLLDYYNRQERVRLDGTTANKVRRGRKEINEVMEELILIEKQLRAGESITQLAQKLQRTPDKVFALRGIYEYILTGVKPKVVEIQKSTEETNAIQTKKVAKTGKVDSKEDATPTNGFVSDIEVSMPISTQAIPQQMVGTGNRVQQCKESVALTYREQCKAKVYKFLKPKVKNLSTVKYYFDGVDIEVVAKKMCLDVYSAIDHILGTGQRFISQENRLARTKRENIPTSFELYCAIVPFDQELYEEPLKAQLVYMKTLPSNALTKLTRSVERVIMSEADDIKMYLINTYGETDEKGKMLFDFAEMLSGEDDVVKALYPKFQKEFTYILDKSRNSWSM